MSYKTEQRTRLYEVLKANPHRYFSARELEEALSPCQISLSAIYRNLAVLTEEGVVRKSVKKGSREAVYRYADGECCRNEIHMTCTVCGRVFHMEHELASSIQDDLAKAEGFALDKSKTMMYGICKDCQEK